MRIKYKFKIGDQVMKTKGYEFCGTVVSCFVNQSNEKRYVVEHEWGWLMIFNEDQLINMKYDENARRII